MASFMILCRGLTEVRAFTTLLHRPRPLVILPTSCCAGAVPHRLPPTQILLYLALQAQAKPPSLGRRPASRGPKCTLTRRMAACSLGAGREPFPLPLVNG